jgi:hypothetical protein
LLILGIGLLYKLQDTKFVNRWLDAPTRKDATIISLASIIKKQVIKKQDAQAYCFCCFLFRRRNNKEAGYPLVYRLLKLALVLPVATATVERCFSAMRIVKTYLRNRLSDDALKYNLICYVEKEEMRKVTNDAVIDRFEILKNRRGAF